MFAAALSQMPHGNAGWTFPIDPIPNVQKNLDVWTDVIALLRDRAHWVRTPDAGPDAGRRTGPRTPDPGRDRTSDRPRTPDRTNPGPWTQDEGLIE